MKMIDITQSVYEGMPVYKNKPEKQPAFKSNTNGHVTESRLEMDAHTGTHIDAPLHMVNDGDTFESISMNKLIGEAKVFDLSHVEDGITKADIEKLDIQENDFILFKTRNSYEEEFNFEFIFLKEDGARYLAEKNIRGVGIDSLGIERSQPEHPTHKSLFAAEIIVIEGLRLKDVEEKSYQMIAAPMKLVGTDASPARVLLFDKDQ
ncbi:cyclase family protein [Halobacillus sp. Marseille-P3879]|uniref:cyclase family protein n=1 Tax=Halobacillus sp. Marseille-P3879 TaxID=2045014 RepID=UPI000C7BA6A9|nr:cyclase family protein [Halobacillus sp. Marseille-P3879]